MLVKKINESLFLFLFSRLSSPTNFTRNVNSDVIVLNTKGSKWQLKLYLFLPWTLYRLHSPLMAFDYSSDVIGARNFVWSNILPFIRDYFSNAFCARCVTTNVRDDWLHLSNAVNARGLCMLRETQLSRLSTHDSLMPAPCSGVTHNV